MKFNFTIFGIIQSLKNDMQFNRKTGSVYHKKDGVRKYKQDFAYQVPAEYKLNIDKPVRVSLNIFKRDNRKDGCNLSGCVYDALQYSGVIKNDRKIVERHEYDFVSKECPRCEIFVEVL